jgi:hypothetical protein
MRTLTLTQNFIANVMNTVLGLGYEGLGFVRTFTAPETKQYAGTYAINLPENDNTKLHKNISAVLYNNLSGGVSPGLG